MIWEACRHWVKMKAAPFERGPIPIEGGESDTFDSAVNVLSSAVSSDTEAGRDQ